MITPLLLISRWIGAAHERWREKARRGLGAEIDALREEVERLRGENRLLRGRLDQVDSRRRPHYTAWERLDILLHARRYGLSIRRTARAFVVSTQTIVNWKREAWGGGALVRPRKALKGLSDLVGDLAHRLKREWPRWGTRRIAGVLARLSVKASRTSVQRLLRRRPLRRARGNSRSKGTFVRVGRPDQVWLMDFTVVKGFLRTVVVGAVMDAYSRKVLALQAWRREPTAWDAVSLLRRAVRLDGLPRRVVTDRGCQFTSSVFQRFLARNGVACRFDGIRRHSVTSRIERFWRTLKGEYADRWMVYRSTEAIEDRLAGYVGWYNRERPHEGMGNRTPDEAYRGIRPRGVKKVRSGRLRIAFMQCDRRLPVFRLRATA